MSETVYRLPEPEAQKRILREEGHAAYVDRLVVQYGPFVATSHDLRLFQQVRSVFVSDKDTALDQLYIREMSRELSSPRLQERANSPIAPFASVSRGALEKNALVARLLLKVRG